MLHGDGPHTWEAQATPIPMKNPLTTTASGIDINSFWLPYGHMPDFHVELNAWHPDSSHRGCQWPAGQPVFCSTHNFEGRGPAPAGWIEKDYGPVETNSSHNWWPFDPDNPDNGRVGTGGHGYLPNNLKVGNYVEMRGTLWQDISHATGVPPAQYCWNEAPFQNQGGWLELHPVDSIRRVSAPGLSPYDAPGESAKQGIKRIIAVALCSDANGNSGGTVTDGSTVVCPDNTQTPKSLVPHFLPELIDGRFTDTFLLSHSEMLAHGIQVDGKRPDCVDITARLAPGAKSAHFKATYVVWWTPPSGPTGTQIIKPNTANTGQTSGAGISNRVTPFQQGQLPALAVTVCPTVDGKGCTSFGPLGRPAGAPVMDIVTVTSAGKPVAGATVSVSGQPTITAVTNASGVAVITHQPCFAPGSQVPKVGQTTVPVRTQVPCGATVSKSGYQPFSTTLP